MSCCTLNGDMLAAALASPLPGVDYASGEEARRWIESGDWIAATFGDALRASAQRYPGRLAFVSDERELTFAELDELSDRLGAALLDTGLRVGDRALVQQGTNVETALTLAAMYKAGIVPVCAVPQYREIEIRQLADLSGARAYFVQADHGNFDLVAFARRMMSERPAIEHLYISRGGDDERGHALERLIDSMPLQRARDRLTRVPVGFRDVLSFQLSGGTTGVPKIIPRFHGEYLGHARGWTRRFEIDGDACLLWPLPLLHNAGQLFALLPPVLLGTTTVLMPRIDIRRLFELIERHRVTHAMSIGPIAPQIIAYPDLAQHNTSSLRMFGTMSGAERLEAHLGVPCVNFYGITEGLLLGSPPSGPPAMRHKTHGRSGCGEEIVLIDPETQRPVTAGRPGELCFRGPSSLRAYYGRNGDEGTFTHDGFFRSGDIVSPHIVGGELCYAFEGRTRDNVNRGGEKIGCEEVESLVACHPAIAEAKLTAMPDPVYGEKGCIFVVLRPEAIAPTVTELAVFLVTQGLAKFKCPERIETIGEFPLTRVGKLDRPALKRIITEKLAAEAAAAQGESAT